MTSLLAGLVDAAESSPIDFMDWLPPQEALHRSRANRVLLRTGNQWAGKTTAGCAEVIWRARGRHPWKPVPQRPIGGWIVSSSEQQSGILQEKLWALLPRDWVHPDTWYEPSKGAFRGKYPKVGIRSEHGGWSWYHFRWTGQHGLNLASASLDLVWFDEPPANQRAYSEVERRLTRTGGCMILTFTPVNAPIDYLRDLADKGLIEDLHFSLIPENLIPVGCTEPIKTREGQAMDAAWIEEQRALVPSYEAPVILDGAWEFQYRERVFEAFDPEKHVIRDLLRSEFGPRVRLRLCLGIDYGEEALRTIAVLVGVDDTDADAPTIYVLGEYVPDTPTALEDDARGILAMLSRVGVRWHELDEAWGDKAYTDARGRIVRKDSGLMLRAIAHRLRAAEPRPRIMGAKHGVGAGRGARQAGIRFVHMAMVRPGRFLVDASCRWGVECLLKFRGGEKDIHKDWVDALRYSLRSYALPHRPQIYVPNSLPIRRS